jgi:tetratricopeptide (TPR) repeat protein
MKLVSPILATVLLLACVGAGHAQVPRGYAPQPEDARRLEANTGLSAGRLQDGVNAIQAKNFDLAESIFEDILRQTPNHPDASFMAGVAEMSLGKWSEAKQHLEVAVKKNPKSPDPKSRLGVTLAKLGDTDGALNQRAELAKMDKVCKGACPNAQWITNGIAMIDGVLPPKP